jgi:hypothetical protein
MHEFEALLFSDCRELAEGVGQPALVGLFDTIRGGYASPEDINDSPMTHPSRRILDLAPGYQKPLVGNQIAQRIGLERIRAECPHFDTWMQRLESIR